MGDPRLLCFTYCMLHTSFRWLWVVHLAQIKPQTLPMEATMIMRKTLVLLLCLGCCGVIAQTPPDTAWTRILGDEEHLEECYSVQETCDSGFILVGRKSLPSAGAYSDLYLVKTDDEGIIVWDREYDLGVNGHARGNAVRETEDGEFIVAGWADDLSNEEQGYLLKTDSSGNRLWDQTYGGADFDAFESVRQTADGGYLMAGSTVSLAQYGYSDAWLVKTDGQGIVEWSTVHGGSGNEDAMDGLETTDGGFIFVGMTDSEGTFDIYDEAILLVKTDASGQAVWFRTFDHSDWGDELGESIAQTTDGGYILGGWFEEGADPGIGLLLKTDSSGNTNWSHTYDWSRREVISSVCQTNDGGFAASGRTNSTLDESYDVFACKLDAQGNHLWSMQLGGGEYDAAYEMRQTNNNGYIIGGMANNFWGLLGTNMYLIRLQPEGGSHVDEGSSALPSAVRLIGVYPNPILGVAAIEYDLSCPGETELRLMDTHGREVSLIHEGLGAPGLNRIMFSSGGIPKGAYILQLRAGEQRSSQPCVVFR